MSYYDPHGQRRLSQLQTAQQMAGAGQYMGMQGSPTLGGQGLGSYGRGAARNPYQQTPGQLGAGQQYPQSPYMPQVSAQVSPQAGSAYGTSPAAQYIAATHAAAAQSGLATGQVPGVTGATPIPGTMPYTQPGAGTYNPQPAYAQGQPGIPTTGGVPVPGMTGGQTPGMAHSYPGTSGQYGYGHQGHHGLGDHIPSQHHNRGKKKSKIRKIVEELLYGTAGIAATNHLAKDHRRSRTNSSVGSGAGVPPDQKPPRGSALGFLHPQGHFVPSALDYMVDHFVHGKKERNLAPEGAKPGFLHPGGHFVPMAMDGLVAEFAHTLIEHHRHGRGSHSRGGNPLGQTAPGTGARHPSSSSDSEYSDSDESDYSSDEGEEYGRHGRTGHSRRAS
jgi:hypothetical protein